MCCISAAFEPLLVIYALQPASGAQGGESGAAGSGDRQSSWIDADHVLLTNAKKGGKI